MHKNLKHFLKNIATEIPVVKLIVFSSLLLECFLLPFSSTKKILVTISCIYFLSGIFISFLPIMFAYQPIPRNRFDRMKYTPLLFILILFLIFGILFKEIISHTPLEIMYGDMLPVIKIMCQRFIDGTNPNAIMPALWGGFQSVYLPFMWLPYCPAIFFHFDMRYISCLALLVSLFFLFGFPLLKKNNKIAVFSIIPLFLLLSGIYFYDQYFFTYTQEGLIGAFYIILGTILICSSSPYLIGIAFSFCLLSRYSILPWVVFYFFILCFQKKDYSGAVKTILTIFVFCLAIFLITKTWSSYTVFLHSDIYYLKGLQEQWQRNVNQLRIENTLGMVKLIFNGNYSTYILYFKLIFLTSPFFFYVIFLKKRNNIPEKLLMICSLKFCLLIFYNFMPMPFLYLFYTNTLFSFVVLSAWILFPKNTECISDFPDIIHQKVV